jgi:nitrite reductase (NADH) large subunit
LLSSAIPLQGYFSAAKTLRNNNQDIGIVVICDEEYPAYQRHRLKDFFAGRIREEELFLCKEDFYPTNRIDFLKDRRVNRLDVNKKRVLLRDDTRIGYDYLIIGTGQRVRLPEIDGIKKQGVFSLDNLQDIKQLLPEIKLGCMICLIGGLRECLAVARIICHNDIEIIIISEENEEVTELSPDGGLNEKVNTIKTIKSCKPAEIIGDSQVKALRLTNGKIIGTSLILFIGNYKPCTEFLRDTSIGLTEGFIAVDQDMRTNIVNVFAAGSVCRAGQDLVKVKTWQEAQKDGERAAQSVLRLIKGETGA